MLIDFLSLLWSVCDVVFGWFILIASCFGVDYTSFCLAALAFSLFIGYVISPYIRNPLRSADQERSMKEAAARRRRRG